MDVLFVASVAIVTAHPPKSRELFIDALGLPLQGEGDGYYSSGSIRGCNHFGVWPLSEAAEPWGQTVTRLLTGDGVIVGISYAPAFHDQQHSH